MSKGPTDSIKIKPISRVKIFSCLIFKNQPQLVPLILVGNLLILCNCDKTYAKKKAIVISKVYNFIDIKKL